MINRRVDKLRDAQESSQVSLSDLRPRHILNKDDLVSKRDCDFERQRARLSLTRFSRSSVTSDNDSRR